MKHWLSKSTYMLGAQCQKALYLNKYFPHLKDPVPPGRKAIFRRGHQIGDLAWELFPGGLDASPPNYREYAQSIERTARAIAAGTEVIYEAAFQHNGVLAALDILVRKKIGWHAFEVKSGTHITQAYLKDAALQYYVITGSGLELSDFSLILPDKSYVRDEILDPNAYFQIKSVLEHVKREKENVASLISICKKTLADTSIPEVLPGTHCQRPYTCNFFGHCHRTAPILETGSLPLELKYSLYNNGVDKLSDIPADHTIRTDPEYKSLFSEKVTMDRERLSGYLDQIKYPLCFIDFECTMPAIPLYKGTHPYEAIPFLYCIRRIESAECKSVESVFFHKEPGDPRPGLCQSLFEHLQGIRSVITFGGELELRIINVLMPSMIKNDSNAIDVEVYDLKKLFSKGIIPTSSMNGHMNLLSSTLAIGYEPPSKAVTYQNGFDVVLAYEDMIHTSDLFKQKELETSLLSYCSQDVKMIEKIFRVACSFISD